MFLTDWASLWPFLLNRLQALESFCCICDDFSPGSREQQRVLHTSSAFKDEVKEEGEICHPFSWGR